MKLSEKAKKYLDSVKHIHPSYPNFGNKENPLSNKPPLLDQNPSKEQVSVPRKSNPKITSLEPFELVKIAAKHNSLPEIIGQLTELATSTQVDENERIKAAHAIIRCANACLKKDLNFDGAEAIEMANQVSEIKNALALALDDLSSNARLRAENYDLDRDVKTKNDLLVYSQDLRILSERLGNISSKETALRKGAKDLAVLESRGKRIASEATGLFHVFAYAISYLDFSSGGLLGASLFGSGIAGLMLYLKFKRQKRVFESFALRAKDEIGMNRELLLRKLEEF